MERREYIQVHFRMRGQGGRLTQQLNCLLGCLHPTPQCLGFNPSSDSNSSFQLKHTLVRRQQPQYLGNWHLPWRSLKFLALGFDLAQSQPLCVFEE